MSKKFVETTNNVQLMFWLKKLYPKFDNHVVARDKLKDIKPKVKQIIIINLNTSKQSGSHWVMIVCKSSLEAIYFDSYGVDPPQEVMDFMTKYVDQNLVRYIFGTTREIQKGKDRLCGYYCMHFLLLYVDKNHVSYEILPMITRKSTLPYAKKLFKMLPR